MSLLFRYIDRSSNTDEPFVVFRYSKKTLKYSGANSTTTAHSGYVTGTLVINSRCIMGYHSFMECRMQLNAKLCMILMMSSVLNQLQNNNTTLKSVTVDDSK